MNQIIVIGGGAAGMMASLQAARTGAEVVLLEKNEKLGKKIYITGKGRCNLTNTATVDELLNQVVSNRKFLYSSLNGFSPQETQEFFKSLKLPLKIERGGRVFPVSDKSSDVIKALEQALRGAKVTISCNTEVSSLWIEAGELQGVLLRNGTSIAAGSVIVATGGFSYPVTGSTGDGYKMAKESGHRITELYPSLVPFEIKEDWVKELQGLSLKNIQIQIRNSKKVCYEAFGEMVFTHFGVSGPVILTASCYIGKQLEQKAELDLSIDLKPALNQQQLDARVLREFEQAKNKQFKNILSTLFPAMLIPVMAMLSGIPPEKKVNEITKQERLKLVTLTKNLNMRLAGLRGFNEAIITRGGIDVRDINPTTMESRKIPGLYFAGEVMDIDAVTGGYNLQLAWSTGSTAGLAAANR